MSKKKKLDKAKRKLTKIQEAYQLLQERYNEMDDLHSKSIWKRLWRFKS